MAERPDPRWPAQPFGDRPADHGHARVRNARNLFGFGTSSGYSTAWLADAVRSTGGQLVTANIDPALVGS